ncbi:autotransporter domain-containing protein [Oceanicoccus sp. KOV_DT_Chl]|uniref:autotransporter outer membrane beta-barrel domain-containing protein n=1 Tax=Oceanicoccus sp. KOV_DT_Chl TaxID=1904639 RepID=UPI00135B4981|nr:autotransporter outer membrane beta-barrel domain-containing protein [Oceanicoccus sp. KOV_DT_Chl]
MIDSSFFGTQSFDNLSTSITVTGNGSVDAFNDGIGIYDDGILLEGGDINLTSFTVQVGGDILAGWDAFYVDPEFGGPNTIGDITIAGSLSSIGYVGGIGVSIDGNTTVTGDVRITPSGSFTGTGTAPSEDDPTYEAGVEQAGVVVLGTVNGSVTNAGSIAATNGMSIVGFVEGSDVFTGTLDGNLVNTGTIQAGRIEAEGLGGLVVMGGASVGGNVQNNGDIDALYGTAGIRITSRVINSTAGEVDGFTDGTLQTVVSGSVINNGTIISEFDGIALNDNVLIGGDVRNAGTINVSSVPDGDAAAIYIGDDNDIADALPTITGSVINTGTLISDTTNQMDGQILVPVADRIGTVVLETASGVNFRNESSGTITNLDAAGTAIESLNANDTLYNAGSINGIVRMNGGEFASDGGTSGSIIGASALVIGSNGQGITTTTVEGNLTFGGQLTVIATAESGMGFTANGQLDVQGDANLNGATVRVGLTPGSVTAQGDEFSFVSASGTLTSNTSIASGINITTGSPVVGFTVEQRGQELFAIAGASDFGSRLPPLPGTEGGKNIGNIADALNNVPLSDIGGTKLGNALSELQGAGLTDDQYSRALKTLDPETIEGTSVGAMAADTAAAGTVANRQSALRGSYGFSGAVAGDPFAVNGFWVQAYDNETDQDVRDEVDGFDADTFGFALGLDAPLSETSNIGAAFSYADTDVEGKEEANEMSIESFRLAVYGSYNAEDYYIDAQVGYAANQYESDRLIDSNLTPGEVVIATGDHDGDQYTARVRGGYPMATEGNWFITPKVELNYTYLDEDSYTEKNADNLGLEVDTDAMEVLIAGVGVTFAYPITTESEVTWIPEFSLDYMYDFIGDEVEVDSNFIGVSGGGFITNGASTEQEMYKASLRVRTFSQGNFSFSGGFDYIGKDDYSSQSVMATVRYDF